MTGSTTRPAPPPRRWWPLAALLSLLASDAAGAEEPAAGRELGYLTRAHPLYHSSAELDEYYRARAAAVPSLMRVDTEMEDNNENNPDASRRASPLVGGAAYPDAHRCGRSCQARRTLSVIRLSEDVGSGKRGKPTVLLLFGEHAREVISDEVCLFLVQLFTGDEDAIDAHTGGAVWSEMVKFVYRVQRFGELGMAGGEGARRIEVTPSFEGEATSFEEERYEVGDVGEVKRAMLEWARALMARAYVLLVPNALREGRAAAEKGQYCARTVAELGDLNRDYDFHWKRDGDGSDKLRPFHAWPTRIVAQLALRESPTLFTNYHSGEFAFYFPWDYTRARSDLLPAGFDDTVSRVYGVCGCNHGVASVMSTYVAHGAAIDYMHGVAKVPYSFTVEVFGPNERGRYGKPLHEDKSLFPMFASQNDFCFWDFNPLGLAEYSDTLAMWGAATMVMMRDVVEGGGAKGGGAGAGAPLAEADGVGGSQAEPGAAPAGAGAALENQRLAAAAIAEASAAKRGPKPDAPMSGQIGLVGVVALLLAGLGVAVAGRGRRPKSMYHGRVMTV